MAETDTSEDYDLLPREEALQLLQALVDRLGLVSASKLQPMTERDRHRLATGHALAFGCCRSSAVDS